ncbi:MAG: nickel pincer cofactor biosynthesis protein LarB [Lachnospiraceae bacterium]|nr:nickel pincer cofactor biosynthesis protein LarB [Lachnospiraceae bacterium]
MDKDTAGILKDVSEGRMTVEEAVLALKKQPYEDIDFARVDLHRRLRQGTTEVIYGAGKSSEQIGAIVSTLLKNGQTPVLITRIDKDKAESLKKTLDIEYHEEARVAIVGSIPKPSGRGKIVVATGGTSDIPVAEEAAITAEVLGNEVVRLYDVGVAGLHRLMSHLDEIMSANVIIAVAGMEGALASVIGGLADCPVIAVPTSVGYGASFGGLSALLSMLNSCASGVSVVNIDNGFGAGYTASMINHR